MPDFREVKVEELEENLSQSLQLYDHYGYTTAAFDGPAINLILDFKDLQQKFIKILQKSKVVIFSRVDSTLKGRLAILARN